MNLLRRSVLRLKNLQTPEPSAEVLDCFQAFLWDVRLRGIVIVVLRGWPNLKRSSRTASQRSALVEFHSYPELWGGD
jgi:hypothetical protein